MAVRTVWATPDGDKLIAEMARVSNPSGVTRRTDAQLIAYLIRHKHWSPLEMANLCVEVDTTRDIGRQFLRHWTLRPQEFSQRYADIRVLSESGVVREARMQHPTNRQASLPCNDAGLAEWWEHRQRWVWGQAVDAYAMALDRGIAREVARVVLPEGMTPTRLFFNGNLRSWLHFTDLRTGHGTQAEAVALAAAIEGEVEKAFPAAVEAYRECRLAEGV